MSLFRGSTRVCGSDAAARTSQSLLAAGGQGLDFRVRIGVYGLYVGSGMLFGVSGLLLLLLCRARHALRSEWPFIIIIM